MKKLFTLYVLCSILVFGCTKEKKDDVVKPASTGISIQPIESGLSDSVGNPSSIPVKKKVVKIKYPKPKK